MTTKALLDALARRRGFNPATANFQQQELDRQADLINEAVRHAWGHALWPQLCVTARAQYRETWSANVSYAQGDQVLSGEGYWESLEDGNLGNAPGRADAWKRCEDTMICSIIYADYGVDEMDLDAGAFMHNPDRVRDCGPLRLERAPWGANVIYKDGETFVPRPYIRYRPLPPRISAAPWNAEEPCAVGDLRLHGADTWVCLHGCSGSEPSGTSEDWAIVRVPDMFADFAVERAAAQYEADEDGRRRSLSEAEALLRHLRAEKIQQIRAQGRVKVRVMR